MWLQKPDRRPLVQPSRSHSWCCRLLLSVGVAPLVSSARCGQNWSPILQITWKELRIFISVFPSCRARLLHSWFSLPLHLEMPSRPHPVGPRNWVIPSFLQLPNVLPPQIPGPKCSEVTRWFLKDQVRPQAKFWVSPEVPLAQHPAPCVAKSRSVQRAQAQNMQILQVSTDWWLQDL